MIQDNNLPTPLTREALYALVWSEPMLKVAARYDVSSSYMARVCTLLNVPRPHRSWADLLGVLPAAMEIAARRDFVTQVSATLPQSSSPHASFFRWKHPDMDRGSFDRERPFRADGPPDGGSGWTTSRFGALVSELPENGEGDCIGTCRAPSPVHRGGNPL